MIKISAAFTEFKQISSLTGIKRLQQQVLSHLPQEQPFQLEQIRLGNEFCERLIPTTNQVNKAITLANQFHLGFALVLANLTDQGHKKLQRILPILPHGCEIVVNDWGTAYLVTLAHPNLKVTAGRLLCKHLKEARISTPAEDPIVKWPVSNEQFLSVLADLNIQHAEVDLAPHTRIPDKKIRGISLGMHLERGYSAKSHVCTVGSLHQPDADKFTSGHRCRRECLEYITRVPKIIYPRKNSLEMYQRGTTWFYNYSDRMNQSIALALQNQRVDRAIVTMDWGA